jgi:hypothetical protein
MDPQGQREVADAAQSAGSPTYPPGAPVYDADGEKLGTVSDRQDKEDFLVVHKGRLFGHDASVPRAAIERADADGVHLRVRKDELKGMNQTPLPEPTAPIRPITGAPEASAPEASAPEASAPEASAPEASAPEPLPMLPTLPMTPSFLGPEVGMGAAAVAATAFSHDAMSETAPANGAPEQSTVGAAQDAAEQAGETARQGVEQVADAVRERVGPVAEQVKDQAAALAQQQMSSAAEGLDSAAGLVTTVGDQLRESNLGALSHYTDLAADQMKQAAMWLRRTTPEEIARNVEDLAKKQPELFVAAAVALGLLGLRLLRGAGQDGDESKDEK